MDSPIRIGIGTSRHGDWDEKFRAALDALRPSFPFEIRRIEFSAHDWQQAAADCDAIIWKPDVMGPLSAAQVQAQIYVLEFYHGKLVVPNARTIWHFENKVAQHHLFRRMGVPTPASFASFDYHDSLAALREARWPLVFKEPHGASSAKVDLVRGMGEARRRIEDRFCWQLWGEAMEAAGSKASFVLRNFPKRWFRSALRSRLAGSGGDPATAFQRPAIYWQEFIPENDGDLRITVIGDRHAIGFWRRNRPNDFRASGSGRIDYDRPIPEEMVRYCIELNRKLGFDSMAYDILFTRGATTREGDLSFVILEMSYGYMDGAVHDAPGCFELDPDGGLRFVEGNFWPQALWIDWFVRRIERELIAPRAAAGSSAGAGSSPAAGSRAAAGACEAPGSRAAAGSQAASPDEKSRPVGPGGS